MGLRRRPDRGAVAGRAGRRGPRRPARARRLARARLPARGALAPPARRPRLGARGVRHGDGLAARATRGAVSPRARRSGLTGDEPLELALEAPLADRPHLERQADPRRGALRRAAVRRRVRLREPQDARVGAEVVVAQLGPAVEPELAHDRVLERAREEVGEEVRPGLLRERLRNLVAREDVVAVLAAQALDARAVERGVERAVRPAAPVGAREAVVALTQRVDALADRRRDLVRPVVQQRRHRVQVDAPAAPARDRAHVDRERAAGDDADPRAHPGNASWSMKASLKSARPESSTYSTSSRIDRASARSRSDSAAIFAPSPATFPAERIRGIARRGTTPMRIALMGER